MQFSVPKMSQSYLIHEYERWFTTVPRTKISRRKSTSLAFESEFPPSLFFDEGICYKLLVKEQIFLSKVEAWLPLLAVEFLV